MKKLLLIILLIFLLTFNAEMALRTKENLFTMDYSCQGQPFVNVPAKDSIDLETMDYAFQGQPFVSGIGIVVVGIKWNAQTISKWNGQVITKWNGM
jgi:hypothetical protein